MKLTNSIRLTVTSFFVFVYLIIVNIFAFPVVFPDGIAEKFMNARAEPIALFHLLAFAATAVLLTIVVDKLAGGTKSLLKGLSAGIWLGLLVSLPEHLHLFAMTEVAAVKQFTPVIWIVVTWGLAGYFVVLIKSRLGSGNT